MVHPGAYLGRDVQIGPFCVIEDDVVLADGCVLESNVTIKSGTTLGPNNHIFEGAVIGGLPQHVDIPEVPGRVTIGSGNTIRENATIHRALKENDETSVGDNCMLMINVHVAHDCRVGNHVIAANNTMLAGHVTVGDRANLSGAVAVHQYCRIGSLAMVGGQAHIIKDVPPFVTVDGLSSLVVGLNRIGLRRAGFSAENLQTLKEAYRILYRRGFSWREILRMLEETFTEGPALELSRFLATTTRGITNERRQPEGATIKFHEAKNQQAEDNGPTKLKVTAS
jgi:UDP-N-acetylglucosamine acyltransferase